MTFPNNIQNKKLRRIAEKVYNHVPVTEEDALCMLTTNDVLDLGAIAHYIRTRLHGDIAYYGVNINLHYTNICELRCPLCAYSCDENDDNAFLLSRDDIEERIRNAVSMGIDEVHIVLKSPVYDLDRIGLAYGSPEGHGAQADWGDVEIRLGNRVVLHRATSFSVRRLRL